MREILFRAWIKKEKMINPVYSLYFGEDDQSIQVSGCGRVGCCICTDEYQPDEVILMQYTGLLDMNGVKIFEGDITEVEYDGWKVRREIVFSQGAFQYHNSCGLSPMRYMLKNSDTFYGVVIGNIHENPELLEVPNED
ncbi:hypothetical protein KCG48_10580 [Proteiniclasticum sp. BAD-10]|uniref:YopX protein domain-containing protein n=1 Tax=Proteiniclasticum sediminis TaxID=2804028 RepID=A0A941HRM9_9CLOT|nr:YopX family protein [Proteiniclasticum sediminis]MBR0576778.1 hypothetical protein [Proteiniclasticum sediminis]